VWIKQRHTNLKLRKSGFYVSNPGFLGASPDGMLEDDGGNIAGIIEIKCLYSAANLFVKHAKN